MKSSGFQRGTSRSRKKLVPWRTCCLSSHFILLILLPSLHVLIYTAATLIPTMASLHIDNKSTATIKIAAAPDESSSSTARVFDDRISHVAQNYRGTSADEHDMAVLGKKQVLRRNFSFITMLGFASTCVASWEGILTYLFFVLTDGGTALLFWGFVACATGQTLVYASLAEMASMSPTAGGQYHWVSEFSPPRAQKLLSYLSGWLTGIGWQVYLASVCFLVGTIIQGLIVLNDPTYVYQRWHGTLLAIAVVVFCIIFNTTLASRLPLIGKLLTFPRRDRLTLSRGYGTGPPHLRFLRHCNHTLGHSSTRQSRGCSTQIHQQWRLANHRSLSNDRLTRAHGRACWL